VTDSNGCPGSLAASDPDPAASLTQLRERHLFLPHLPPEEAYLDDAIVTKRDAEGQPISSSSQPAVVVIMLDQLDLAPDHRVIATVGVSDLAPAWRHGDRRSWATAEEWWLRRPRISGS
jgi:hypothetical protein